MPRVPYWLRHLRNLVYRDPVVKALEDPFAEFAKDPFFRNPLKYISRMMAPLEQESGIDGAYSESEVKVDGKKLEVHLDVQNFTPEQIQVRTVGNEIIVEGRREMQREGGWTRSHFERRFLLPAGFPPERVECHLDRGRLRLVAFRAEPQPERDVPVQDHSANSANSGSNDGAK